MEFTKGHGTGNDFVILPDPDGTLDLTPGLVAALCDRRRGLGGDGVLRVVRAAKHPEGVALAGEAEWFMDYWNSDGSFAEMCGNGARVFVRYLLDRSLAAASSSSSSSSSSSGGTLPIATRAGLVRARVEGADVAVEMRRPRLYDTATATLGGLTLPGAAVDVGNPHLVCALPAALELTGLDLTRAPEVDAGTFPAGVNVEFTTPGEPVTGADAHVLMRVYERGSAETLSCGTGACAVGAVALRDAGLDTGTVAVDVPGGRLTVTVTPDSCWLSGPAVLVATGTLTPSALTP
ncbi:MULTISPECIES: diaminopimelate epimerase [unclassified Micromonospora]|uniref:diaminopimelate epimerase n=1 Tax=unclassified Micromonospora TaxID=2617518 RepID=UPI0003EEA5D9|nr:MULTISPECIES: diaminopimelate epimerase [unclassified Micromonospora]EWM65276.1 diaminopimelate epimerase [Micromonospora sp. M42]MCK1809008.1 diaminopimelate epimerase [Micromonospora sp. R42106]MCK1831858.1 diaminopimelate epimerase [Micromonospora sp. R42003]MCK1842950.1 diaminopimelate epimerase [Micromonospora sp. R42004]MCM1016489.1 diaminopimelate epimerase [Micromonospora sp. XM-20-01]